MLSTGQRSQPIKSVNRKNTNMLSKATTLKGYQLRCLDGGIGRVEEFYFDDQHWAIRYLVANTGSWLRGRQILISPQALRGVNGEEQSITIDLTMAQIEDSPSLESDKPVSRQFEEAYHGYYGWPVYWSDSYEYGTDPFIMRNRQHLQSPTHGEKAWDPHLRSTRDVMGHHIQASDGEIGHAEDFIIDDENWAIRYLIVDTRNWWPGKRVLVSPQWIERVSWEASKVFVNLSRAAIQGSPEYKEGLLTRDYEAQLHSHYQREGYWVDELAEIHHSR